MPLQAQAAVLRAIEERQFQRVGGSSPIQVDVRIIAATNRNLDEAFEMKLPSLSEHREDIPLLAAHFIRKYGHIRQVLGFTEEAQRLLVSYDWPGNVRELEHCAIALGTFDHIRPEDLPEALRRKATAPSTPKTYHERVAAYKKTLIAEALRKSGGDFTEAALELNLHRTYLYRLYRDLDSK
jgi:DNA-binding NtrC family response regulator